MLVLRDFQNEAVSICLSWLADFTVLLQAPTGSGKTVMAAAIADEYIATGKRVLFLAPRRELVDQAADKFEFMDYRHGYEYGIIMAGEELTYKTLNCPLQIASKDTLHARKKRGAMDLPAADLVIADEAHLSLSPTWIELLEAYRDKGAHILGLTATPARGDGAGLGYLYDRMYEAPTVRELMNMRYLSEAKYFAPSTVDLEGVKKDYKKHDYQEGEISRRMSDPTIVGDIVSTWLKLASTKRTVVFCAGVKHSILVKNMFLGNGVAAEHVDGTTPTNERNEIFERFRSGETQILCNCMVATYGFDLPEMDCVVLARPTMSIILHLQMIGRGLRVSDGKDHCLVLDHAGNINRLGFADDPVPWSLDGGSVYERIEQEKAPKEAKKITCEDCSAIYTGSRECPECGWEPPVKKGRDINVVDGELVSLSSESPASMDEIMNFYLEMRHLLRSRGKKEGAAYYATIEKYDYKPPYSWLRFPPKEPTEATLRYDKYKRIKFAKAQAKKRSASRINEDHERSVKNFLSGAK